ncbi:Alkanal monooxygenase alpha chain [Pseudoruegeria aquimaris]|uniref:Alkanal monooxygenase alpha chain n=1 Tax=Pseudoruegeria aquimaris TaxID=393663 RepID=A0A1Y5TAI6_9RHOB|nr:LLM class oxidoreductase [Pseudoruegeria aquimaris]SLN59646.1 Alkanal monooxygenase alpha chain [Pseudoruegeria aquimaris]
METPAFEPINRGFAATFRPGRLSLGLVVPITAYPDSPVPDMEGHLARVQKAEALGFKAIWLRDVPFNVPSFGDAGQLFDPFTYLGYLAGQTRDIALGVASIVLPLRHPAHVAKAAASADVLSGGRLILGVASGDRPEEYPAMAADFDARGQAFRESFAYIRAMGAAAPRIENRFGHTDGRIDMLPKPTGPRLPLLITGSSRQAPDWIAEHGDGWMTYPRGGAAQGQVLADWRARLERLGQPAKPVLQPLYVDLAQDPDEGPSPIHLGVRTGHRWLLAYLKELEALGVNHVALNLRFNRAPIDETLDRLARDVLPHFS